MVAKDIVRTQNQISKITEFSGQLKALSLRISGISTLNEMTSAMENASNAMSQVSSKLDAGKLAQLSKEMAKDDAKLEMKQDMLSEVLDGIGESMDDPAEQEKLYQQVLLDCGVQLEGMVNKFIYFFLFIFFRYLKLGQIKLMLIRKKKVPRMIMILIKCLKI